MNERHITLPMVFETLRLGVLAMAPEPSMRSQALECRMVRFVAGMQIGVVVAVEHPSPRLTVITVLDIRKD